MHSIYFFSKLRPSRYPVSNPSFSDKTLFSGSWILSVVIWSDNYLVRIWNTCLLSKLRISGYPGRQTYRSDSRCRPASSGWDDASTTRTRDQYIGTDQEENITSIHHVENLCQNSFPINSWAPIMWQPAWHSAWLRVLHYSHAGSYVTKYLYFQCWIAKTLFVSYIF